MTTVRVSLVDVYVLRPAGPASVEVLALRRSTAGRCPGAWETVHGHIEGQEGPVRAAVRELGEETGLEPLRLYNLSRVETFYRHLTDEVALIPVFGAIVAEVATNGSPLMRPPRDTLGPGNAGPSWRSSNSSEREAPVQWTMSLPFPLPSGAS